MPDPLKQQAQAHALGAGVSRRLAQEYRDAIKVAEGRVVELVDMAAERRAAGLPVPPSWALQQTQMQEMRDQMTGAMVDLNATAAQEITTGKRDAVGLAQRHAKDYVGDSFHDLPTSAVEEMVRQIHNARPGTPFGAAMARYPRVVNRKMESTLVQAVALGYGPRQTVKFFRDGMAGPYRQYDNLARTEIMGAYTRASISSYRENQDHLSGWRWVVEPRGALCPFCSAKADTVHPLSESFNSHPSCRCTTEPVLKDIIAPPPPPPPPPPPLPPKVVKPKPAPRPRPAPKPKDPEPPPQRPGESDYSYFKRRADFQQQLRDMKKAKPIPLEVTELRKAIAAMSRAAYAKDDAHRLLELPGGRGLKADFTVKEGRVSGAGSQYNRSRIMDRANQAREWLDQRLNGALLGGREVKVNYEASRAFYSNGSINMSPYNETRIHVHEMGHWIEDTNPEILEQSKAFLARRTLGDEEQRLSDITGNPNFADHEVARPDKFVNPYIGKYYYSATEVLSMGLEELYDDPVKFAQADPEHFEHTVAAMHGHYNSNQRR